MKKKIEYYGDYFRCIIRFANGLHKVIRMSYDKVASFVTKFREMQRSIFRQVYLWENNDEYIVLNNVVGAKFINERTHQELLTIS